MGINSLGELIIYICSCSFDPGCEDLNQNNPFKIHIYANLRGIGEYISYELMRIILVQLSK